MKIISKFKDYYDYLIGIYGEDSKLILDRRKFSKILYNPTNYTVSTFHIGEWKIQGIWYNDIINYGIDINNNPKFEFRTLRYSWEKSQHPPETYYCIITDSKPYAGRDIFVLKAPKFLGDKSPTWNENCPILLETGIDKYITYPILREYSIQKVLSAEQIYQILSEWLGKQISINEPTVPIGDDKIRIQSHGFDLKNSFRPK